jgi:hypothetical protein
MLDSIHSTVDLTTSVALQQMMTTSTHSRFGSCSHIQSRKRISKRESTFFRLLRTSWTPTRNNMHTFSAVRGLDICSNKSLTTSIPLQHRHTVRRHSAAAGAAPCAAAVAARRNAAGARGIRCRAATVSACNKFVMISACLLLLLTIQPGPWVPNLAHRPRPYCCALTHLCS